MTMFLPVCLFLSLFFSCDMLLPLSLSLQLRPRPEQPSGQCGSAQLGPPHPPEHAHTPGAAQWPWPKQLRSQRGLQERPE